MLYLLAYSCDGSREAAVSDVARSLSDDCFKLRDGVWIVEAEGPATVMRDRIRAHLEEGDTVAVMLLAGHAVWDGYDREESDWLLARL